MNAIETLGFLIGQELVRRRHPRVDRFRWPRGVVLDQHDGGVSLWDVSWTPVTTYKFGYKAEFKLGRKTALGRVVARGTSNIRVSMR